MTRNSFLKGLEPVHPGAILREDALPQAEKQNC
jgi:hypothetical protein